MPEPNDKPADDFDSVSGYIDLNLCVMHPQLLYEPVDPAPKTGSGKHT